MFGFTVTNDKYIVERNGFTKQIYLKNKEGKLICGPHPAYYNVFFCGDEVIYEMDKGNGQKTDIVYHIYHIVDNKKIETTTSCNEIRAMNNGNLVLGIYSYEGIKYVIYNSKGGNITSDFFDYVGEFSYSDDGVYSALARFDVEIGQDFGNSKIHFWGRINGDGKFISPLYNSVTNDQVFLSSEHSLYDEIEESRKIMIERRKERKKAIENLPIIEPYGLHDDANIKKR